MLRLLTIPVCVLAIGGGFAIPRLAASEPGDKSAALQRLASVATTDSNTAPVAAPGSAARPAIPARMLGPSAPIPIPPALVRVRNGWLRSDGRTLVAVYAGAAGNDPSVGRLVIVRQDLGSGRQSVRIVGAGATGPLAIEAAPAGRSAGPGGLRIRAAGGGVFRLDLGSESLTRSSRTAVTVARPQRPRSSDQVSDPYDR